MIKIIYSDLLCDVLTAYRMVCYVRMRSIYTMHGIGRTMITLFRFRTQVLHAVLCYCLTSLFSIVYEKAMVA